MTAPPVSGPDRTLRLLLLGFAGASLAFVPSWFRILDGTWPAWCLAVHSLALTALAMRMGQGGGPPARAVVALCLFAAVVPSVFLIGMRAATLPWQYVHDSAVQTEEAMAFLLAGRNPYVESYASTPMARVPFFGGKNPALEHVVYYPGSFLVPLPVFGVCRLATGRYDHRLFLLLAYGAMLLGAWRAAPECWKRHVLVAVGLNPAFLFYLIQGANDSAVTGLLFLAFALVCKGPGASRSCGGSDLSTWGSGLGACEGPEAGDHAPRPEESSARPPSASKPELGLSTPDSRLCPLASLLLAAALVGVACSVKQTAWFFAVLFVADVAGRAGYRRGGLVLGAVFAAGAALTLPFVLWDPGAFLDDTYAYLAGTAKESYPAAGLSVASLVEGLGLARPAPRWLFSALQLGLVLPALLAAAWFQWCRPGPAGLAFRYSLVVTASFVCARYFNASHLAYVSLFFVASWFLDADS
ncbi:MAG: hypothetical protein HY814_14680 [Candidatus Riflebacteria bacterium]|nr:hypothetical protein [Candidatus Riflebacteria bacterium]